MAGVGTSKGIAKVKSQAEVTPEGSPTATSLTEYSAFKKALAQSPALISGYSKLLKSAGYYKGPVTTKYTPALQKALDRAEAYGLSWFYWYFKDFGRNRTELMDKNKDEEKGLELMNSIEESG